MSFKHATRRTVPTSTSVTEEASEVSVNSGETTAVYSCPQNGCVRVFQRPSALEKHLSLEKCRQSLERHLLMDLAKMGYKPPRGGSPHKSPRGVSDTKGGMVYWGQLRSPIYSVININPILWRNFTLAKRQAPRLTLRWWHEKCDEPAVLMVFVFFRDLNSCSPGRSRPSSLVSAAVRQSDPDEMNVQAALD